MGSVGLIPSLREIATDLLERSDTTEGRCVLVDQDHTEMTYAVAELLAQRFTKVTIMTSRERLGHDMSLINRQGSYQRLRPWHRDLCNVEPVDLDALENAQLGIRNVYSGALSHIDDVVAVTHASSRIPNDELLAPLQAHGLMSEQLVIAAHPVATRDHPKPIKSLISSDRYDPITNHRCRLGLLKQQSPFTQESSETRGPHARTTHTR